MTPLAARPPSAPPVPPPGTRRRSRPGPAAVLAALVALALSALAWSPSPASAQAGGPVILDGTDSGLHGYHEAGEPMGTWLYASKAYGALLGAATAGTEGSIAVIGAAHSTGPTDDCGAMANYAGADVGATVTYHDGEAAITSFFADLGSGTATPRVIHIVEAAYCTNGLSPEEDALLTSHASQLADFVNSGGGLFAQYHSYGWLTSLLPDIGFTSGGGGSNPELTPEGMATLPGLTSADIASPWHGHFTGDFGALDILASEAGQHVIIGGASVVLPSTLQVVASAGTVATGSEVTITATVADADGTPVAGATVAFEVTGGPNAGTTGTGTSDADGTAAFAYTGGSTTGTDTVTATATIEGSEKVATVDVVWATLPAAPTAVTATAGDGEAAVEFSAPADGGTPITGYTVTASPGGATASGAGSPIYVTGLDNGTEYTFTVVAQNAIGAGPASAASGAVTPAGPPDPPTITGVRPLDGGIEVAFTAGDDGGSDITGYTATVLPGGATATGSGSPLTITGLENGTAYRVTITATSPAGTSIASSPSDAVTPVPYTVPGPVADLTARATPTMASVTWSAPASDGGSAVTGYVVEYRPVGSGTWTAVEDVSGTSTTLVGLDPATSYEVRVRAENVAGPGADATASFRTLAVPGAGSTTAVVIRDGEPVEVPVYRGPTVAPVVSVAGTPSGDGSWVTTAGGHVYTAGDATFHGSLGGAALNAPITSITPTAGGGGYYLVASDGGVFAFGDAVFRGSMGDTPLNQPVQGIVPTCGEDGYYLVALDGGVFAFGDARFHGSMGGTPLNKGMLGIVPNCELGGYWTFAADGGVFTFGENEFYGSLGGDPPASGVVAMAAVPDSKGYWLIAGDGTAYPFGSAASD